MWPNKKLGFEYENCVFKLNIASKNEITMMYASLQQRADQGWSVENNEVFK